VISISEIDITMMRKDRSVCQGASCKKFGAPETFADLADAEIMKGAWE